MEEYEDSRGGVYPGKFPANAGNNSKRKVGIKENIYECISYGLHGGVEIIVESVRVVSGAHGYVWGC